MMFPLAGISGFEFVRVSALRTEQLVRGCTPRVPQAHRPAITAQREVAAGKVCAVARMTPPAPHAAD